MVSLFKITDDRTGVVTYRLFDRQRFISPEYSDLTQLEADYSGYAPFPNPAMFNADKMRFISSSTITLFRVDIRLSGISERSAWRYDIRYISETTRQAYAFQ